MPGHGAPFDPARPSAPRVYDYLLGGKDNFPPDRELAERLADGDPGLRRMARENRAFVLKAVAWCGSMLNRGQFIDLGCGMPSRPAVHDAARGPKPGARVAYVDRDPVVLSHARALDGGGEGIAVVEADVSDPASVLGDEGLLEVIDLSVPVAVVLGGTLSAMPADVARSTVKGFAEAMAPGSAVVISCASYADRELGERMASLFGETAGWHNHGPADISSFFAAGGLRISQGRVMDLHCWPLCPAGGAPAESGGRVLGGVGIRA